MRAIDKRERGKLGLNLILLLTVKGVDEFCLDEILRGDFLWKSVDQSCN